MKIPGLLCCLFATQVGFAQFKLTKLDSQSIPAGVHYTGKIVQAVRWTDSLGDNVVVLTTATQRSKNAADDGYSDGVLSAFHYLVSPGSARLTWKVHDEVRECPVDMFLYFIKKTFAVTDLNKDGKAEVWMMYRVSCQGDVSPVPTKIIMYQENKKFAVRGTSRVKLSPKAYMGGDCAFDDAFKNAPAPFQQYAKKLWKLHRAETFEQ
jgi:hypothetical protein